MFYYLPNSFIRVLQNYSIFTVCIYKHDILKTNFKIPLNRMLSDYFKNVKAYIVCGNWRKRFFPHTPSTGYIRSKIFDCYKNVISFAVELRFFVTTRFAKTNDSK